MSRKISLQDLNRVLASLDAPRNGQALYALLAAFCLAGLMLASAESALAKANNLTGWIWAAGALVSAFLGLNTTGLLLMDQARGRPVRDVADALRAAFPIDWADLAPAEADTLAESLREALADPQLPGDLPADQVERLARQFPQFAESFIALHGLFAKGRQRLEMLDEAIGSDFGGSEIAGGRLPWEEVRDWFHLANNYVDRIDRDAETLAHQIAGDEASPRIRTMQQWLRREGVTIEWASGAALRRFDASAATCSSIPRSPTNRAGSSSPIRSPRWRSQARSPKSSPPRPCKPKQHATSSPLVSAIMRRAPSLCPTSAFAARRGNCATISTGCASCST